MSSIITRILPALLLAALVMAPAVTTAQEEPQETSRPVANPADVASIDAIITALYETVSGPAGPREWDRMASLFADGAQMIPTNPEAPGGRTIMSVEDYKERAGAYFKENGFFESEISREIQRFGNIAHVFTTYESRRAAADTEPFVRGINSVQLLFHEDRWWIVNIYWQSETEGSPIPAEYLP